MKRQLFFLFIGFFISTAVKADCSGTGLWVFPSSSSIKQNPIFILEGYAYSQDIIIGLNTKYPVYLKSGDKKVRLNVIEVCVGQFHLTQALLKPESELEAGDNYTLYIDNLKGDGAYNNQEMWHEAVYKVESGKDTLKPQVPSKPKEINKKLMHYGCGPAIHVVFTNPATDSSAMVVKTTVKNLSNGKATTYYHTPRDGKIEIGHGMCSGAFVFDDSNNYEVEFSFLDSSGNLTPWSGKPIKFTKPTKSTDHDE